MKSMHHSNNIIKILFYQFNHKHINNKVEKREKKEKEKEARDYNTIPLNILTNSVQ